MANQLDNTEIQEKLTEIEVKADQINSLHRDIQRMNLCSLSVNILGLVSLWLSPFKKFPRYSTYASYLCITVVFLKALYQYRKFTQIEEKKRKVNERLESVHIMLNERFGSSYNDVDYSSDSYHETTSSAIKGKQKEYKSRTVNWKFVMIPQVILNFSGLFFLRNTAYFRLHISDNVRNVSSLSRVCVSLLTNKLDFEQFKGLLTKYITSKEKIQNDAENANTKTCKMVGSLIYTSPKPLPEQSKLLELIQQGQVKSNLNDNLVGGSTTDWNLISKIKTDLVPMKTEIRAFNREIDSIIQGAQHCLEIAKVQADIISSKDLDILTKLVCDFETNWSALQTNLGNLKPQLDSLEKGVNEAMSMQNEIRKGKLINNVKQLLESINEAVRTSIKLKQCTSDISSQKPSRFQLNKLKTELSEIEAGNLLFSAAAERATAHIVEAERKRNTIFSLLRLSIIPFRSNASSKWTSYINLDWISSWRNSVERFESAFGTLRNNTSTIIGSVEAVENMCIKSDSESVGKVGKKLTAMAKEALEIYSKTTMEIEKAEFVLELTSDQSAEPDSSVREALQSMFQTSMEIAEKANLKLPSVKLSNYDKFCCYFGNKPLLGISLVNIAVDLLFLFNVVKYEDCEYSETRKLKDSVERIRRQISPEA